MNEACRALGDQLDRIGDTAGANAAYAAHVEAAVNDPQLMAAASAFLYYRMTKPVRELADAADAVRRQGRQATEIPEFKRRDEIGDLSVALRSMLTGIQGIELTDSGAEYRIEPAASPGNWSLFTGQHEAILASASKSA